MNKLVSILLGFLLMGKCYSQSDVSSRFKTILKPSPNETSLIKSTSFQNVNFSGGLDIPIELYNISIKDFNIPIRLKYNTGGIKVSEQASRVGLGWSLEAGGSISRIVNGSPDDKYIDQTGPCGPSSCIIARNVGYFLGGLDAVKSFDDNTIASNTDELKKSVRISLLNGTSPNNFDNNLNVISFNGPEPKMDTYPDNFYLNFMGQSYRLFFSKNGGSSQIQTFTTPYSNNAISYVMDNTLRDQNVSNPGKKVSQGITKFTMLDGEGNKYIFDLNDSLRTYNETGFSSIYERGLDDWSYVRGLYSVSTWNLSQIITINNETIDFTYDTEIIETPVTDEYKVRGNTQGIVNSELDFDSYEYVKNQSLIVTHVLRKIETKDLSVEFIGGISRDDISNATALTDLIVTSKISNKVVKHYILSYDYFKANGNVVKPGSSYLLFNPSSGDLNKRLKLTQIKEVASDGVGQIPPYVFSYNETPVLPALDSKEQDYWGYYNGNGAKTMIPLMYCYPDYSGILRFSPFKRNNYTGNEFILNAGSWNRNSNSNFNYAGSLKKIQYPTSGFEEYVFESNSYENPDWGTYTVGGLRIQNISKKDNSGNLLLDRTYEYTMTSDPTKSSGVLFRFPLAAHAENTQGYYTYNSSYTYSASSLDYFKLFTFKQSTPSFSSGNSDDPIVGYSEISEIVNGNNKTVYKFSTPGDYSKSGDQNNTSNCSVATNGYCDGLFKKPQLKWVRGWSVNLGGTIVPLLQGSSPRMNNLDLQAVAINIANEGDFYPFLPSTNYSWNRGLLLSETKYNAANDKVYEKTNTYSLPSPDDIFQIPAIFTTYEFNDYNGVNDNPYGSLGRYIAIYGKFYLFANASKLLINTKERFFSQSGQSMFVDNDQQFNYQIDNRLTKSIQQIKSNGSQFIQNYFYASSSSTILPSIKAEMLSRNMKSYVIDFEKKYNLNNSDVISRVYSLNSLNNTIYLKRINQTRNGLLTDYTENLLTDAQNNTLTVADNNMLPKSYLWDYKSNYPIAEVINSSNDQIAATSFEADSKGGWAYAGTITTPASGFVPTGKKYYSVTSSTPLSRTNLTVGNTYIVSYWRNVNTSSPFNIAGGTGTITVGATINNQWTYFEHKLTATLNTFTISGTGGAIDELRFYPVDAQMTTYTYDPLVGITSQCDASNRITYYEYDGMQRLILVRDQNNNIVKQVCYNYQGQPGNCQPYSNDDKSGNYVRNNCSAGYVGGAYNVSIPAGTFSSAGSVADANTQAIQYGQAQANANGSCTVSSSAVPMTSTNSTAVSGFIATYTNIGTGARTVFTIPAAAGTQTLGSLPSGTYNITISKAGNIAPWFIYGVCTTGLVSGAYASFSNIVVSSTACKNLSLSSF